MALEFVNGQQVYKESGIVRYYAKRFSTKVLACALCVGMVTFSVAVVVSAAFLICQKVLAEHFLRGLRSLNSVFPVSVCCDVFLVFLVCGLTLSAVKLLFLSAEKVSNCYLDSKAQKEVMLEMTEDLVVAEKYQKYILCDYAFWPSIVDLAVAGNDTKVHQAFNAKLFFAALMHKKYNFLHDIVLAFNGHAHLGDLHNAATFSYLHKPSEALYESDSSYYDDSQGINRKKCDHKDDLYCAVKSNEFNKIKKDLWFAIAHLNKSIALKHNGAFWYIGCVCLHLLSALVAFALPVAIICVTPSKLVAGLFSAWIVIYGLLLARCLISKVGCIMTERMLFIFLKEQNLFSFADYQNKSLEARYWAWDEDLSGDMLKIRRFIAKSIASSEEGMMHPPTAAISQSPHEQPIKPVLRVADKVERVLKQAASRSDLVSLLGLKDDYDCFTARKSMDEDFAHESGRSCVVEKSTGILLSKQQEGMSAENEEERLLSLPLSSEARGIGS